MKTIVYTIADKNNLKWAEGLERSFKHFHPDIEFKIYKDNYITKALKQDDQFFYKATPWIAKKLFEDYDHIVKIDADSVVTGKLDSVFENDGFDVDLVLNFNQRDQQQFGNVGVFNISPQFYYNCGFVSMRSKEFVEHWWELCNRPYFKQFQYREQDLLNIIAYYGNYRVRNLDNEAFYGLASKDYWPGIEIIDDKLVIRFLLDGKEVNRREVKAIHWGEGKNPGKMNFDLRFPKPVAEYLNNLTKYE